jgi:ABC-2 type transport system ATP-binding protein
MNAIETHQLTRLFGRTRAVDSVSLEIPEGTIFGLLGANGAGKSTLLKLIAGHLRPTSGAATVLGRRVLPGDSAHWLRMGYVSQSRYLPGWMTGAECLRFARAMRPEWDDAKVEQLVFRLAVPLDTKIRDLSRGHYVRLQIGLALAHNPAVILLDEPTSGLDPAGRHELLRLLIDEIGLRGRTVVFSTHLVEDVERLADSVAILDGGSIVANGPIDTLKASGGRAEVSDPAASLEQVFFEYVNRRSYDPGNSVERVA